MANYQAKIDLLKIDGASLQQNAAGKLAVIIPVEEADLFVGKDNRAVYLDLNLWESRPNQYNNSHGIKKSYSKARREMLGADAIKNKPFIGNASVKPDYNGGVSASSAQQPMVQTPPAGFVAPPDYTF